MNNGRLFVMVDDNIIVVDACLTMRLPPLPLHPLSHEFVKLSSLGLMQPYLHRAMLAIAAQRHLSSLPEIGCSEPMYRCQVGLKPTPDGHKHRDHVLMEVHCYPGRATLE